LQEFFHFNYFFPNSLLIKNSTIASIATTIKIPTPIPALKIPPITEQLVNEINIANSKMNFVALFVMVN
jgi:hypothetical protein